MLDKKTINIPVSIRENGECFNCTIRLIDAIKRLKGIQRVDIADEPCRLDITYDPNFTTIESIENYIIRQGLRIKSHYDHRHYMIEHLDCPDCALNLEQRISKIEGVTWVSLNFATATIWFEYEPEVVSLETIRSYLTKAGYCLKEPAVIQDKYEPTVSVFKIAGLDVPESAKTLHDKLTQCDGITQVEVNFPAAKLIVRHDSSIITASDIMRIAADAGYTAAIQLVEKKSMVSGFFHVTNRRLVLTGVSAFFIVCGFVVSLFDFSVPTPFYPLRSALLVDLCYLSAIIFGGYYAARSGLNTLLAKSSDMNVLMTIAVIGAVTIGEIEEGAIVAFLFSLGNLLQSYTLDKTRNEIRSLMELAPREAHLKTAGVLKKVPISALQINDVVIVKPGEKIPADGIVLKGQSSVNESPITGESVPVAKYPGTMALGGTINGSGVLEIRVQKRAEDSTYSRIIHLVEEAQAQKAPSQQFVEKFSKVYTPAVILSALLIMALPPLFMSQPFKEWFYRGLMLLVISCPCALVISTPVSIVSAIANASRNGILIKGGAYLEEMARIQAMAFDKTGTITKSRLTVTDVIPLNASSSSDVLRAAACLEMVSEHHLSKAILKKATIEGITYHEPIEFIAYPGKGIKARINGDWGYAGSLGFFIDQGITVDAFKIQQQQLESEGKTTILVQLGDIQGIVGVADTVRSDAALCIQQLKSSGIKNISLISGDNEQVVAAMARQLGVTEYYASMLPEQKLEIINKIMECFGKTAMVGDGINDAPALAASTVGIAMGIAGTDTAIETADIALMSDDLLKLPFLIQIARKTLAIIKTNICISILVKMMFVIGVFAGFANLWLAVVADTGTSLLVILNGMRLANFKRFSYSGGKTV